MYKIPFYLLGLVPWPFIMSLLSFYFHAGLVLDYLPAYDMPDPRTLDIYRNYSPFIDCTSDIWFYSLIVWILYTGTYLAIKRKQALWKPILLSAAGHTFGILLLFSGIFEWYID